MAFPDPRAHRILTEHFELRCYQPEDAEELQELAGSPAASACYEAFDDQGQLLGTGT